MNYAFLESGINQFKNHVNMYKYFQWNHTFMEFSIISTD